MPSICGKCSSRNGFTCCELAPGTEDGSRFPLTKAEIARISVATGKKPLEFVEPLANEPEKVHDGFKSLSSQPVKFSLKTVGSACVFLKKGVGCTLAKEIRPHHCRLYPFWFKGDIEKGFTFAPTINAPSCLAKETALSPIHLATMLGTTAEELGKVAEQFAEDVAAEREETPWPNQP